MVHVLKSFSLVEEGNSGLTSGISFSKEKLHKVTATVHEIEIGWWGNSLLQHHIKLRNVSCVSLTFRDIYAHMDLNMT
jgi:hypothetical protein